MVIALSLQTQFKLIQRLDKINKKDPIISNEYIWGPNHEKIAYALGNISTNDRQSIKQMINNVTGVPKDLFNLIS